MQSLLRWVYQTLIRGTVGREQTRPSAAEPQEMFAPLEDRRLMSAGGMTMPMMMASPDMEMSLEHTRVKVPKIVGTYRGTVKINNGPTLTITVVVNHQKRSKISGNVSITGYGADSFKATGTIKADRTFTFNFSSDSAGVSGHLEGKVSKKLTKATGTFEAQYFGTYTGTFSITKL